MTPYKRSIRDISLILAKPRNSLYDAQRALLGKNASVTAICGKREKVTHKSYESLMSYINKPTTDREEHEGRINNFQ